MAIKFVYSTILKDISSLSAIPTVSDSTLRDLSVRYFSFKCDTYRERSHIL
ncbi:hypothetical protein [Cylindrospermopsis raciborskii]|uniref:hypothetical protein n=1 Tax=Cylindrospermopsis raciborskii TaxID=77022 RepID=UPI0038D1FD9C